MRRAPIRGGHIDFVKRRVCRDGKEMSLTPKENALLLYLCERPGTLVDRNTLLSEVWKYRAGAVSRAVDNTLCRLRRKLERHPDEPVHLVSWAGEGVRFDPGVEVASVVGLSVPEGHRLPLQVDAFFGRSQEVDLLLVRLKAETCIVVHGPPGVGKRRLAHEVGLRWPGTCYVVPESAQRDGVRHQLAQSMGLAESSALPGGINAEPSMPLFLLNDPNSASLAELMTLGIEARVVVTRVARPDAGIPALQLRPLAIDDAVALLEDRNGGAVSRAKEVAERLHGLPLALEMAAARLRVLGVDQLLARIDDGRPVLPVQGIDVLMRGVWQSLSASERSGLSSLLVFSGGATVPALEHVWQDDALDLLDQLVDRNLVAIDSSSDEPRFTLFESVAAFVRRVAAPSDESHNRHQAYFAHWGTEEAFRSEHRDPRAHSLELRAERRNLAAAFSWEGGDQDARGACGVGLCRAQIRVGAWPAFRRTANDLELMRSDLVAARPLAVMMIAYSLQMLGHSASSEQVAATVSHGRTAVYRIYMLDRTGKPHAVVEAVNDLLASADAWEAGELHNLRGNACFSMGRFDEAEEAYVEGLRCARSIGDQIGMLVIRGNLAGVGYHRGDVGVVDVLAQIASNWGEMGYPRRQAGALANRAEVLLAADRVEEALDDVDQSEEIFRRFGGQFLPFAAAVAGDVMVRLGKFERARAVAAQMDERGATELDASAAGKVIWHLIAKAEGRVVDAKRHRDAVLHIEGVLPAIRRLVAPEPRETTDH
jgi:DNA-binding winged helix-turn-helix (wHTH) protein/tetratricopeptide (TPR) repeat protein